MLCFYESFYYYIDAFTIQHCTSCRGAGSILVDVQVQQCSEVGKQENACGALVIRVYPEGGWRYMRAWRHEKGEVLIIVGNLYVEPYAATEAFTISLLE